jgi:hypothetical protein
MLRCTPAPTEDDGHGNRMWSEYMELQVEVTHPPDYIPTD